MDHGPSGSIISPHVQSLPLNVTTNTSLMDQTVQAPNDSTLQFELNGMTLDKPWPLLKQPLYVVILLATAYGLVSVVGIVSNSVVVAVICRQVRMRTVINYFLANLAVADIFVCVVVLPITLLQNVFTEWWYGPVLCKAAPYLQGISVSSSVNTLAAVALERYLAIFYPKSRQMTSKMASVVIATVWVVPVGIFTPWVVVYREKHYNVSGFDYVACHADWRSAVHNRSFTLGVVFLTCYAIPLVVITVFCMLISVKIHRRTVVGLGRHSNAQRNITRRKAKIVRMLVIVFVTFGLSWLPLYVVGLRLSFASDEMEVTERTTLKTYVLPVAQWLGAANSAVNPFIYCYYSVMFRSAFRQVLSRAPRTTHATLPPQPRAVGDG